MRTLLRWMAVALTLAVGGGCSSTTSTSDHAAQRATLRAVQISPLGSAPRLRLGTATGTPMVVNVWATWCAPCRKEMPAFDAVAHRYDGAVRFVGINLGDTEESAAKFIADTGVTFDQYLDPDSTAQAAFSITTMPATVFIRADGTVSATHNGALDEAALQDLLAKKLSIARPAG